MAKAAKKPAKKAAKKQVKSSLGNPGDTIQSIKNFIAEIDGDFPKFEGGTKAAGRRVRKSAQEIRKLCANLRKEIQAAVAAM